ncbi:DEP domain-containing mTOR-interacting protein-like isoform X3 [Siniperca chuatsi]|uniref:DEP domain-containing mTOR-interacting protein-like isoform X3 n=1 Tax=Siniperca chuatsi TaxID=119488 RepID=UPI001CE0E30B|nr:DEP domain-containing mTOR-interacting protein-like isoform X3 [Siniperca chuatsi]
MGPRTAVAPSKEVKAVAGGGCGDQGGARLRSSSDGSRYSRRGVVLTNSSSSVLSNPKSVLKRPVSTEELQRPGGPYIKKTYCGRCSGLGVRGERKQAVSHPGCGALRPSRCCWDEGLSVCGFGQWAQCSQSGLPDCQPPDPNRTQNCGYGGDGGD